MGDVNAASNPPIHTAAHHEAAHAIVGHLMGLPVVSIEVFEGGAGLTTIDKDSLPNASNEPSEIVWGGFAMLVMSHAGTFASKRIGVAELYSRFSDSSDFNDSMEVVYSLIEVTEDSIKVQRLLACVNRMARVVVAKVWPAIDSLAVELSEKGRLDGEHLQHRLVALVGQRPPFTLISRHNA